MATELDKKEAENFLEKAASTATGKMKDAYRYLADNVSEFYESGKKLVVDDKGNLSWDQIKSSTSAKWNQAVNAGKKFYKDTLEPGTGKAVNTLSEFFSNNQSGMMGAFAALAIGLFTGMGILPMLLLAAVGLFAGNMMGDGKNSLFGGMFAKSETTQTAVNTPEAGLGAGVAPDGPAAGVNAPLLTTPEELNDLARRAGATPAGAMKLMQASDLKLASDTLDGGTRKIELEIVNDAIPKDSHVKYHGIVDGNDLIMTRITGSMRSRDGKDVVLFDTPIPADKAKIKGVVGADGTINIDKINQNFDKMVNSIDPVELEARFGDRNVPIASPANGYTLTPNSKGVVIAEMPVKDILPGDDGRFGVRLVGSLSADGQTFNIESAMLREDGNLVKGPDGKVVTLEMSRTLPVRDGKLSYADASNDDVNIPMDVRFDVTQTRYYQRHPEEQITSTQEMSYSSAQLANAAKTIAPVNAPMSAVLTDLAKRSGVNPIEDSNPQESDRAVFDKAAEGKQVSEARPQEVTKGVNH